MDFLKENKFSRIYISNKKKNEKLYFKLDFKISIYEDSEKRFNVSIDVMISYLLLVKKGECFTTLKRTDNWEFISNPSFKACDLRNSIMIYHEYRSFGIGSFLLNEILLMANKYIPDYSLSAELSVVDEKEEDNKKRRNLLYKNIGFAFRKRKVGSREDNTPIIRNEIHIDKLSNLNFNRKFDYIELLNEYDIAELFCQLTNRNKDLNEDNNRLLFLNDLYKDRNKELPKTIIKKCFLFLIIVFILSYLFLL